MKIPEMILLLALGILLAFFAGCDSSEDSTGSGQATADDDSTDDDDNDAADDDSTDDDDDDDDNDDDDDDDDDDDNDDDDTAPVDCPALIDRQPYLQLMTQNSVNVLWLSDQEGDSLVEWGETESLGRFARDRENRTRHEMVIDGLEPGTRYYYRARTCLDQTSIASFRTAPDADTPFHFVAFSDNQDGYETFTVLAAMMAEEDPWFAMSSGDIVDDGWNLPDFKEQLFDPAEELLRSAPLYPAIGNHEGLSPHYFDIFHFPNNDRPYYSFLYGNVFILVLALDTWHIALPGTPQHDFMVDALSSDEAQNADFRLAFFHTPPWTEGWVGYDGDWIARLMFVPKFEQYGLDAYFCGHTHDFERGLRNGVTSYIIGGAGGGLDTWARDVPHITVYHSIHHYVSIDVDGPTMTINAIDLDGAIFDTNVLTGSR